jgi:tRNA(Ile)-lysidine synthase
MERAKGGLSGIDFAHAAAVLELAASPNGTGSFRAAGVRVCRSFDWLCFTAVTAKASGIGGYLFRADAPGVVPLPAQGLSISLELIENRETSGPLDCVYNKKVDVLDWQRLSGPLEVRNWRPGDLYQPVGSATGKKLKALFQEARVPVWERPNWPVLTDGGAIVWTRRFGPAARVAAGHGAALVLQIREIRNRDEAGSVYSNRAGREVS